jgi:hypothetical protein
MPDSTTKKLSVQQFAAKVRAKYPGDYDALSDSDLVARLLKAYPEYRDFVDTGQQDIPTMGPAPQKSLLQRVEEYYTTPSAPYEGTLDEKGKSPREKLADLGKAALAASLPALGYGLFTAPAVTALGLIGGAAGASIGSKAGGYIGEQVGAPTLGEDVGGLVGGLAGGELGTRSPNTVARILRNPATPAQARAGLPGSLKRILPGTFNDWLSFFVPKGELGTVTRPGPYSAIPLRAPRGAGDPFLPYESPPGAPLPSADEFYENRAQDIMQRGKQQAALEKQGATTSTGQDVPYGSVVRVPEPNEALPPVNPKYMASVPRNRLAEMALSRTPGAATQLQQLGNKVIYEPPSGFPGPRETLTPFSPRPDEDSFLEQLANADVPDVEIFEPVGPRQNASGQPGGGGLEEQARMASETSSGVKYYREFPGGRRVPLIGLGRQDLTAGPGQRIIRVDANGGETVLDEKTIPRPSSLYRRGTL